MTHFFRTLTVALGCLFLLPSSPSLQAAPNQADDWPIPDFDYEFARPIQPGEEIYMTYRKNHAEEAAKRLGMDPKAIADGMDTWHWWVGVDNPGFWRDMAGLTGSSLNLTNIKIDFLRVVMTVPREERYRRMGLINDPDTVASETPDQFGLKIDRMKDGTLNWNPEKFGYSSGVIGLQLFKNEKFDAKKWSLEKYLKNPKSVEPPYVVGMSCGFCHVGFDPLNAPENPAEPKWENLSSAIGNQYFREGRIFQGDLPKNSFVYQYLETQEPGTSETSRFPSDFINGPIHINSIYRLTDRLKLAKPERITKDQKKLIESMYKNAGVPLDSPIGALGGTEEEPTLAVPHVLADGADSMGVLTASVRVYVNEGMMYKEWYDSLPINPFHIIKSTAKDFAQSEFDIINTARKDPNSPWMQTERRMPNMATFLESYDSYPLSEAKGAKPGSAYQIQDKAVLARGKLVFADNCASCHSSKVPANLPADAEGQKAAWRALVLRDDFLANNYLSDDQRHSVLEIGTNAQRASGTNAHAGHTWGQMSSQTYKDMRSETMTLTDFDAEGKAIPLYNPLTGQRDITWKGPAAAYRTPSLVSIWATAPYLHNNSLGAYTHDPSLVSRMAAFDDATSKMFWPERRLGVNSIKVTSEETSFIELFPGLIEHFKFLENIKLLTFPKGTPINMVMNFHLRDFPALSVAYIGGALHGDAKKALMAKMVELSQCPDFIEDRGHTYGSKLSDDDKKALIEYMKYF